MTNPLYDELFGKHAGQNTPFLILPDGTVWTHKAFLAKAAKYARVLKETGLETGDRVAVQVEKSPDALALYAACVQAGLVFLPLNTAYTVDELSYFIDNSGARAVICDPARREDLKRVAVPLGAKLETLDGAGQGSLPDKAKDKPDTFETVARVQGDLAAFLYTSGTTGRSKGAMLTQANLLSNARTLAEQWRFTDKDVLLHALPIFHTHG
ncbi:MAG: AMP-binding protein, partial [Pseudomonadota bacterium]